MAGWLSVHLACLRPAGPSLAIRAHIHMCSGTPGDPGAWLVPVVASGKRCGGLCS